MEKKKKGICLSERATLSRIAQFTWIFKALQAENQPLLPQEPGAAPREPVPRTSSSHHPSRCHVSRQTPAEQGFIAQMGPLGHAGGKRLTQSLRLSSRRITTLAGSRSADAAAGMGRAPPSTTVLGTRLLPARDTAQRDRKVSVPSDGHAKQQEQQLSWWPSQQRLLELRGFVGSGHAAVAARSRLLMGRHCGNRLGGDGLSQPCWDSAPCY